MTDDDPYAFNHAEIRDLMKQYANSEKEREKREIETRVLEETVWSVPEPTDEYSISEAEVDSLLSLVDDEKARRILRKVRLDRLE